MNPSKNSPTRRKGPKIRPRAARWYVLFLIVVTFGTLGASTAVGFLLGYVDRLPPIERLEDYNPQQSSVIMDRSGARAIGEFAKERRHVVPIGEIPELLKRAFLAIEDDKFYQHYGVNLKAVLRSLVANRKAGAKGQGASTITMQLPRNILPEEVGREKKWERKIKETFMSFQIEQRYSKDQILEFYLNHIFMGKNSYGIYAAADTYFSKEPKDLTLAECATLAAIPKGPSIFNPITNPEKTGERRDLVLDRMRKLKWISEEQYQRAISTPLVTHPSKPRTNVANSEFPYFSDGLHRDLNGSYHVEDAALEESGLTIQSTINPRYQQIAEEELRAGLVQAERMWSEAKNGQRYWMESADNPGPPQAEQTRLMKISSIRTTNTLEVELEGYRGIVQFPQRLPYYEPQNILRAGNWLDVKIESVNREKKTVEIRPADTTPVQGAVVILDAKTADVLAMVGGADFHDDASAGQFNRAVIKGKPAGSTVKPFFYAAALERGFQPNDIVLDVETIIPSTPVDYKPRNYENQYFGATTLIEALEHSRNVSTVRLFLMMGVKKTLPQVCKFDYRPGDSGWRAKFRPEVPVCLGSVDMTPYEVSAAYQTFVGQGIGRAPQYFSSILDTKQHPFLLPQPQEAIVVDPVVACQMIYMMRQVVLGGTGKFAIGDRFPSPPYPPIAGKTGTTDDCTDAWFTGFTPDLVICCYVGFDTPRTLGPQMTGGKVAAPIWANIFNRIYATRDDWKMEFDAPSDVEKVDICAKTGKRASAVCDRLGHRLYEGVPYRIGKAPRERCDDETLPTITPRGKGTSPAIAESSETDTPTVDPSVLSNLTQ